MAELEIGQTVKVRGMSGEFTLKRLVEDASGLVAYLWGGSKDPGAQRSWRFVTADRVRPVRVREFNRSKKEA